MEKERIKKIYVIGNPDEVIMKVKVSNLLRNWFSNGSVEMKSECEVSLSPKEINYIKNFATKQPKKA